MRFHWEKIHIANWIAMTRKSAEHLLMLYGNIIRSHHGGDYGIHDWWDLIRAKQLSSVPVYDG